ncbi:MAG TPA: cytidine/deoxycytidylate deaminase family protein [Candidatus Nanoarchaeia archaeon]|nr:cytidine/deoxycytidylate deaminase family protein [Candidatus Nanoarchaeia archaeon]
MALNRPSWDEYFVNLAFTIAKRGTCNRLDVGAIITKNKRILTTGYSGSPAGLPHCTEVGCLMRKSIKEDGSITESCLRTTHAEQNAIVQAALHGVNIEGSTIYVTTEPCLNCAKMIINSGIRKVVAAQQYHDALLPREFFKQAGVELVYCNLKDPTTS